MSKLKWPEIGSLDFGAGQSRLAEATSTLTAMISGGLDSLKGGADKKVEEGEARAVEYMLSGEASPVVEDGDDEGGGTIDAALAQKLVDKALSFVPKAEGGTGDKKIAYHWGATGPGHCPKGPNGGSSGPAYGGWVHDACFDCSGFSYWIYKEVAKIRISPPARGQCASKKGRDILTNPSAKDLKSDKIMPGDLVFFKKGAGKVHHVGICMGNKTGKFIHAPQTGKWVTVSKLASRGDIYKIRRYLKEEDYQSTSTGASGPGEGVDVLNGYTLPTKQGYSGNEEPINEQGRVPSTNGRVSFGKHAKLGKAYREYYITMRWNYVKWGWRGNTKSVDEKQYSWFKKKPRIVLVTNTRTGDQIYAVALESGPAPWTGTKDGKSGGSIWKPAFRKGNPSGYVGRSAGFPPTARKALNCRQLVHGDIKGKDGGDLLTFQWAKDQSVKPGPIKKTATASTTSTSTPSRQILK